ncbi:MAG: hypothetical protein AAF657_05390 [Acidobacteriota bacterium]
MQRTTSSLMIAASLIAVTAAALWAHSATDGRPPAQHGELRSGPEMARGGGDTATAVFALG